MALHAAQAPATKGPDRRCTWFSDPSVLCWAQGEHLRIANHVGMVTLLSTLAGSLRRMTRIAPWLRLPFPQLLTLQTASLPRAAERAPNLGAPHRRSQDDAAWHPHGARLAVIAGMLGSGIDQQRGPGSAFMNTADEDAA